MVCSFEITEEQLLAAIAALQKCKSKGFEHSNAIFSLTSMKEGGTDVMASFNNCVILKSHPTDRTKNWGNQTIEEDCQYILRDGQCYLD